LADLVNIGDVFQVDKIVRLNHPGAHLDQNIRPPGQESQGSCGSSGNRRRVRKACWLVVSHLAAPLQKATGLRCRVAAVILSNLEAAFKQFTMPRRKNSVAARMGPRFGPDQTAEPARDQKRRRLRFTT
jgi:hypothetical protein